MSIVTGIRGGDGVSALESYHGPGGVLDAPIDFDGLDHADRECVAELAELSAAVDDAYADLRRTLADRDDGPPGPGWGPAAQADALLALAALLFAGGAVWGWFARGLAGGW